MPRAVVNKNVLDEMIRVRMGDKECPGVKPLPVVWRRRVNGDGCNWAISGWTGDSNAVQRCNERMGEYLRSLRAQFDIPDEG